MSPSGFVNHRLCTDVAVVRVANGLMFRNLCNLIHK